MTELELSQHAWNCTVHRGPMGTSTTHYGCSCGRILHLMWLGPITPPDHDPGDEDGRR